MKNKLLETTTGRIGRRAVLILLTLALLTTTVFAAKSIQQTITVTFPGVKLVVDGIAVVPKDANGSTVEPFIYNGTTYLPVRAVSGALGKDVSWDGTTKTVYIGKLPGVDDVQYMYPYQISGVYSIYKGDPTKYFTMMGKEYTRGFYLRSSGEQTVCFNLDGNYRTLEFDLGHVDGGNREPKIMYIYVDGELYQELELTADMQTTHICIPVNYALQCKLVFDDVKHYANHYGLANIFVTE